MRGFCAVRAVARPRFKIDSPEMWCWRQKFHAYARAPFTGFAQIHDAALLLFLGFRVHQNQHLAVVDFMAQIEQPAVRRSPPASRRFRETSARRGCGQAPANASCGTYAGCAVASFVPVRPCAHHLLRAKPGQLPFRTGVPPWHALRLSMTLMTHRNLYAARARRKMNERQRHPVRATPSAAAFTRKSSGFFIL